MGHMDRLSMPLPFMPLPEAKTWKVLGRMARMAMPHTNPYNTRERMVVYMAINKTLDALAATPDGASD